MAFCESCGSSLGEKSKFCGSCGSVREVRSDGSIKSEEATSPVETTFESKCLILYQVWTEKRDEELFADFIKYGDLGIPLAYAIHEGMVEATPEAKKFIDDVFEVLVGFSGAGEDTGFEDLQDLLDSGDQDFDSDDSDEEEPSLDFFQVNIALEKPIRSEQSFRSKTLTKLYLEYKDLNFRDWTFRERTVAEWYLPDHTIAFNSEVYASENTTQECASCGGFNPPSAKVCYLCCQKFVGKIQGQLFASICWSASLDELEEYSDREFAAWVNVYYFVAEEGQNVRLLDTDLKVFGY